MPRHIKESAILKSLSKSPKTSRQLGEALNIKERGSRVRLSKLVDAGKVERFRKVGWDMRVVMYRVKQIDKV